jgi:hypothetical protein
MALLQWELIVSAAAPVSDWYWSRLAELLVTHAVKTKTGCAHRQTRFNSCVRGLRDHIAFATLDHATIASRQEFLA